MKYGESQFHACPDVVNERRFFVAFPMDEVRNTSYDTPQTLKDPLARAVVLYRPRS